MPSQAETAVNLNEALGLSASGRFANPKTGGVTDAGEPTITFTRINATTDVDRVAKQLQEALLAYDKKHGTNLGGEKGHNGEVNIIPGKDGNSISFKVKEITPEVVTMLDTAINEAGASRQQAGDKQHEAQLKKQVSDAMGLERVADAVPGIKPAEFTSGTHAAITYKVKSGIDVKKLAEAIQGNIADDLNLDKKLDIAYNAKENTISFSAKSLDDPYVKKYLGEQGLSGVVGKLAAPQPNKDQPAKPAGTLDGAGQGFVDALTKPHEPKPVIGPKQEDQFGGKKKDADNKDVGDSSTAPQQPKHSTGIMTPEERAARRGSPNPMTPEDRAKHQEPSQPTPRSVEIPATSTSNNPVAATGPSGPAVAASGNTSVHPGAAPARQPVPSAAVTTNSAPTGPVAGGGAGRTTQR